MLSLLPPQHASSYAASTSHHPAAQSSYDYYSTACNPPALGSVAPYPSPPMSGSSSATAHFTRHADRAFDPNAYTSMRPQPPQGHEMFWAQPSAAYTQGMYPPQPQQHHQTTLPLHSRSPRSAALQQPFLPPLPVSEPYPNYHQSQQAREYVPSNGLYHPMGMVMGQPGLTLANIPTKPVQAKSVRRTKQHVQTACFNCKKAHLSCDVGRPCIRCKQSGKQDTCYNVAHKRRGRPRLRDTFGNKIVRTTDSQQHASTTVPNGNNSAGNTARRRSDPLRVLKSNDGQSNPFTGHPLSSHGMVNTTGQGFAFPHSILDVKYTTLPVAFLDLDLNIVQMNHIFRTVFGLDFDMHGRNIDQFIDVNDRNKLQAIRNGLRQEKDAHDPTYLPPLRMGIAGDADKIPMVDTSDIAALVSQGFQERSETFRLQLVSGIVHELRITIRLARAERPGGVFFAVLVLPTVPETSQSFAQPAPRLMSSALSYNYNDGFQMPTSSYGGTTALGGPQRSSVPEPAPASPFNYTFAVPQSMQGPTPTQLTPNRSSYDTGYYMSQHGPHSIYAYPTQSGVTAQALGGASEPRHFAYQQESSHMQGQFQPGPNTQQQLLQSGDFPQLPPLNTPGGDNRARTAAESQMAVMRQDHYGRGDHQHSYMHDGGQQMDPTQTGATGQSKSRGTDLQNLLQS